MVLRIVAGVDIEPSQIQTTGSKRLKQGSKRYDKEVLLIIRAVYSQIFLKLWDEVSKFLSLEKIKFKNVPGVYIEVYRIQTTRPNRSKENLT